MYVTLEGLCTFTMVIIAVIELVIILVDRDNDKRNRKK